MPTVAIHPPKTPVTKGVNSIAAATIPNVCKMPGPPAPFVPTPLPNIGQSGKSPKDFTTTVKVEGDPVAVRGSSYGSTGDIASKGTGGGIVSNNAEGPLKFIAPGSLTVKMQGKNVQLLGDQTFNNNGPSGSPPNSATMMGTGHGPAVPVVTFDEADFPEKVAHIRKALNGRKSKTLTRRTGRSNIRKTRRAALKKVKNKTRTAGKSWDEFPFASSMEGGAKAKVAEIDTSEQSKQGGTLSAFYQNNGITQGKKFKVQITP
jgi:uncharacterized Zn-binding protein involved in type VI secretion